jgi:predicted PurR-regulated permease PerM
MRPLPAAFFRETTKGDQVAFAANVMIIVAIACGFLYFGREVLVPISLAVLFTFLLTPAVKSLQKRKFPKVLAISTVVAIMIMIAISLGYLVSNQVASLTAELPAYETNLRAKIKNMRDFSSGEGLLGGAGDLLGRLGAELEVDPQGSKAVAVQAPRNVAVVTSDAGLFNSYLGIIGPLLQPTVQTVLVAVFCIFFLFQREDLRDRLIRLAGRGDLLKTTAAMDDAGSKISRLFMMQAVVNASFGLFIGISLWLLSVPAAALWGVFAGLMRFVPYIGSILSAVFPVLLAAAVSPDWTMPLIVAALFILTEPILGQGLEPLLFGHTAGLSPIAVIAAAAFWTAIWGPVGLLLATPLTICLSVVGRHVEGLGFLDVLFGSEPALSPAQTFYQRLLARDRIDASALSEKWLADTSMAEFLKTTAVPSLLIAEGDRLQRRLSTSDQNELATEFSAVLDSVFVADVDAAGSTEDRSILLLPAPGGINFAATSALSASLSAAGVPHKMLDENASSPLSDHSGGIADTKALVLVYLVDPPAERVDFMRRRLKGRFGAVPMIVAAWFASSEEETSARLHAGVLDLITTRLFQTPSPGRTEAANASSA